MAYFDTKSGSLEEAIRQAVSGQINEKVTEYIELEFKDKQAAINAYNTINRKVYPGGTQPFSDINQEGNTIQLDKVDNSKKVLGDFKKVGKLKFKVAVEEKLVGGQKKLDKDKDGDIDGKDFAMLRKSKKENYDIGTPENTKAKLDATPGQSSDEWNQQVETMQKKNSSMREALAKMWGVDQGHNPFKEGKQSNPDNFEPFKKKGKKEDKTMTGKPMTKVNVDPDMKEKKTDK